jgi:hypothetical protein
MTNTLRILGLAAATSFLVGCLAPQLLGYGLAVLSSDIGIGPSNIDDLLPLQFVLAFCLGPIAAASISFALARQYIARDPLDPAPSLPPIVAAILTLALSLAWAALTLLALPLALSAAFG